MIYSNVKALEWSQHFSHYKSMFFLRGSRAANPKSKVRSGRISNPSKLLWLTFLPARMKKIQSKCKRWSGHNIIHQLLRCSRGANSKIGDEILTKFKVIQALKVVLIVCKNEEIPFKIESDRVVTTFLPL